MKRKLLFITICCLMIFASCSSEDENNFTANPTSEDENEIVSMPQGLNDLISNNNIVAHRGAWKKNKFPQNSIASLKEAIRLQFKGSEFDIILTGDDSLVVNHDNIYNNLVIEQSKYSDLISLKLPNGEKLPTLREYIVAGKQNNNTTLLYCELKNYSLNDTRKKIFISQVLECVTKLNAQQYLAYHSFDFDLLKKLRLLDTKADIQNCNTNASIELIKKSNLSGFNYHYYAYVVHPEWIESAQKENLKLTVFTDYNDTKTTSYYLSKKFDAIITDEPELALKLQLEYTK